MSLQATFPLSGLCLYRGVPGNSRSSFTLDLSHVSHLLNSHRVGGPSGTPTPSLCLPHISRPSLDCNITAEVLLNCLRDCQPLSLTKEPADCLNGIETLLCSWLEETSAWSQRAPECGEGLQVDKAAQPLPNHPTL